MTTITRAPLQFWSSGGDVLMRGAPPIRLTDEQSRDLLDLFEAQRRAAKRAGDEQTLACVMCKAQQLTAARIQASRWARASGGVPGRA